ncbi:hypothetical protein BGZ61DRAFT_573259, partial [Ilyonectria robusta]|uniref:uncharacterized protein n=1 Tax=Ilyonectria robusta TaxID=1079257 RepID=UPI001E8EE0A7
YFTTDLILASYYSHRVIIKLLLGKGAEIEAKDSMVGLRYRGPPGMSTRPSLSYCSRRAPSVRTKMVGRRYYGPSGIGTRPSSSCCSRRAPTSSARTNVVGRRYGGPPGMGTRPLSSCFNENLDNYKTILF